MMKLLVAISLILLFVKNSQQQDFPYIGADAGGYASALGSCGYLYHGMPRSKMTGEFCAGVTVTDAEAVATPSVTAQAACVPRDLAETTYPTGDDDLAEILAAASAGASDRVSVSYVDPLPATVSFLKLPSAKGCSITQIIANGQTTNATPVPKLAQFIVSLLENVVLTLDAVEFPYDHVDHPFGNAFTLGKCYYTNGSVIENAGGYFDDDGMIVEAFREMFITNFRCEFTSDDQMAPNYAIVTATYASTTMAPTTTATTGGGDECGKEMVTASLALVAGVLALVAM